MFEPLLLRQHGSNIHKHIPRKMMTSSFLRVFTSEGSLKFQLTANFSRACASETTCGFPDPLTEGDFGPI